MWGEGHLKNGKKDGLSILWDTEGNITKTKTYKNDELVK
jgi:antitoxin component YwqK of YwqJK toxin-antitoxin module